MNWFSYSKPCVRLFGMVAAFDRAEKLLQQIGEDSGLELYINCGGGSADNAFKILESLTGARDNSNGRSREASARAL